MALGPGNSRSTDSAELSSSTAPPLEPPFRSLATTSATIVDKFLTAVRTTNVKSGIRLEVPRADLT